jgi:hypothetical protein
MGDFFGFAIVMAVFVLTGIGGYAGILLVQAWSRRLQGGGHAELEELRERIAALEDRSPHTGENDLVAERLLELEERVEFTERLLARPADRPAD